MHVLVTAGPTREPLDPVRFVSNRSSGRMGFALAERARDRGHKVVLVTGPTAIAPPEGIHRIERVETTNEMLEAVRRWLPDCRALIMAAAPADWRPLASHSRKMKKSTMTMTLELTPTPDILMAVRDLKPGRIFVGFAAETGDPRAEGRRKLHAKGLDLVVANDVTAPGAGFEVTTNRVVMIDSAGEEALPLLDKREVADRILDRIEAFAGL